MKRYRVTTFQSDVNLRRPYTFQWTCATDFFLGTGFETLYRLQFTTYEHEIGVKKTCIHAKLKYANRRLLVMNIDDAYMGVEAAKKDLAHIIKFCYKNAPC